METIDTLRSKIELIDEEIIKKDQYNRSVIDFKKKGWEQEIAAIEREYRKKIEPELKYIRQVVLDTARQNDYKELNQIGAILQLTQQLNDYITPTFEELVENTQQGSDDYLTLFVVMFVLNDLEPDARDEIVGFGDFIQLCNDKKINSVPVLKKLLPYASNNVKYGGHSVRSLFMHALNSL